MDRLTRRQLVGFAALALPFTFVASSPHPTSARIGWCHRDPILEIGGRLVRIDVYSTEEILDLIDGPTIVNVYLPPGPSFKVWWQDKGFGQGWQVSVPERRDKLQSARNGIEIQVEVFVPTRREKLPVMVKIADPGSMDWNDAELVDGKGDDELIKSFQRDEAGRFWTNEWIALPPVKI